MITNMTSHNIRSLAGKCILAKYVILSVTLYFPGITMPMKVNGTHHAARSKEKRHLAALASTLYNLHALF